ncbi:galactose-3-O-sulfotransferase 3-like [Planococcus citri]|uniref:galactose-3-O-sulfotransferase 3-like n=1 Tax=Planococcus citri TaxID=170843 RepID=UPI0031F8350E
MCFIKSKTLLRMNFFSKRRIVILPCICFSALLFLLAYLNLRFLESDLTLFERVQDATSEPLAYKCCTPMNNSIRTNVFFIKTHKTGGTTVKNVIIRFALLNSLDILGVRYDYSYNSPFSDWSIRSGKKTPNNKYNVLATHARYDPRMRLYQYPDTSMVTILRHPVPLFQSLYTYFRLDKITGISFQQLLNMPVKPEPLTDFHGKKAYRGYNQVSVDLGFDWTQSKNKTAVAEFIARIDREFDLVMITEYMDESFVLLANLMGWPLEYVASLMLNVMLPESNPYILTPQDKLTIMDLNQVDMQLYNHFLQKFLKCKRQYGEERLNRQVQQLRIMNNNLKERCVGEEVTIYNQVDVQRLGYLPKNESDMVCVYSMQLFSDRTSPYNP